MFNRRTWQFSIIFLFVFLMVPFQPINQAQAYYVDLHDRLIVEAVNHLKVDDGGIYSAIAYEAEKFTESIMKGSKDADLVNVFHYHDPWSHNGLILMYTDGEIITFGSAADYAQRYFNKAVDYYSINKTIAYNYLGYAIHVLQDLTVPHHARLSFLGTHNEYERHCNSVELHSDLSGIYNFTTKKGHYCPWNAWGWVDYAAHISYDYWKYVDWPDRDDENSFETVSGDLVPLAWRLTSGFLKLFYETANQPMISIPTVTVY